MLPFQGLLLVPLLALLTDMALGRLVASLLTAGEPVHDRRG